MTSRRKTLRRAKRSDGAPPPPLRRSARQALRDADLRRAVRGVLLTPRARQVGHRVKGYLRHARRWGNECIIETAGEHLSLRELMALSRELRTVDPKWKAPPELVRAYARELLAEGAKVADVVRRTRLSRPVVYTLLAEVREQVGNVPNRALDKAL